jgi:hypothetical protein
MQRYEPGEGGGGWLLASSCLGASCSFPAFSKACVSLSLSVCLFTPVASQVCLFRLPKSIAFVKDAFDADKFDEAAEAEELAARCECASGRFGLKRPMRSRQLFWGVWLLPLCVAPPRSGKEMASKGETIIRWRHVLDEDGNVKHDESGNPLVRTKVFSSSLAPPFCVHLSPRAGCPTSERATHESWSGPTANGTCTLGSMRLSCFAVTSRASTLSCIGSTYVTLYSLHTLTYVHSMHTLVCIFTTSGQSQSEGDFFVSLLQPGSRTRDDFLDGYANVQYRLAANTGSQSYITDKALIAIRKARKRGTTKVGFVELNPEKEKEMRIKVCFPGHFPGVFFCLPAVLCAEHCVLSVCFGCCFVLIAA